ncbi:hypothetical protein ABBQ38_000410 [Trebouxia sp. C0009 RCD-2024]
MATVSELVDKGDIPEERKNDVKRVLHDLGYAASRAVGKAFSKTTEKHMTAAGMRIADANAIMAEVESLQGKRSPPYSPFGPQADAKKSKTGPSFHSSSLQAEILEALRVFHSDESPHFVASDTSFSKLKGALQDAGWQVDLTGVVPAHPQCMKMPRPAQFQWGAHESMHRCPGIACRVLQLAQGRLWLHPPRPTQDRRCVCVGGGQA